MALPGVEAPIWNLESGLQIEMLRPRDIRRPASSPFCWTSRALANALGMASSQIHPSLAHGEESRVLHVPGNRPLRCRQRLNPWCITLRDMQNVVDEIVPALLEEAERPSNDLVLLVPK